MVGTEHTPGLATDASGNPVIDPTKNVETLVEASDKRQDDLRTMEGTHVRELIALRAEQRQHELAALKEVQKIREDYAKELREAEGQRINAIRQVDVEAVQRAAEVQATQATALAAQVAASAESMRNQVQAAATAAATGVGTVATGTAVGVVGGGTWFAHPLLCFMAGASAPQPPITSSRTTPRLSSAG